MYQANTKLHSHLQDPYAKRKFGMRPIETEIGACTQLNVPLKLGASPDTKHHHHQSPFLLSVLLKLITMDLFALVLVILIIFTLILCFFWTQPPLPQPSPSMSSSQFPPCQKQQQQPRPDDMV
jgi:hypothetical protein